MVLSLAVAQTAGEGLPEDPAATSAATPTATSPEGIAGPPGVPFMPPVGQRAATRGVFLDLALLTDVRARTLAVTDSTTTWGSELEVSPGVALEVASPSVSLSLGYAPRLTVPFNVGGFELAVLNRATARVEWRPDALWTASVAGVFVVGDYSQLNPASTPGGAGPAPPVLNPVRSFQTYPYVGIDTLAQVDGILSARTRLRLAAGYFDVGGTGEVGQANQPRTWGPQAEAAIAWDASRAATLTTTARGQDWILANGDYVVIGTLTEGWTQAWTEDLDTTVAAGVGLASRDVETLTAVGHFVPVARLSLAYRLVSRQRLTLTCDAALAPYFDAYTGIPYQRVTFVAALDWRPSDAWRLGAALSAALAPYSVLAPESYGTGGVSVSYSPVAFLVLSAGGTGTAQFQGPSAIGGTFGQWTAYFSVALRSRTAL